MNIEEIKIGKHYWFHYSLDAVHGRALGVGVNEIIFETEHGNVVKEPFQVICEYVALDSDNPPPAGWAEFPKPWWRFWR